MSLSNPTMNGGEESSPDSSFIIHHSSFVLSLPDALALAVESLEFRAETFSVAAKLVEARGANTVPWAVKDAARHAKLQAAIETLKRHRSAIKPY